MLTGGFPKYLRHVFSLALRLFSSIISLKSFKALLTNQSKDVVFWPIKCKTWFPRLPPVTCFPPLSTRAIGDMFSRAFHLCHRWPVFPRFPFLPSVTCFPALSTHFDWFITVFATVPFVHVATVNFQTFLLEWNRYESDSISHCSYLEQWRLFYVPHFHLSTFTSADNKSVRNLQNQRRCNTILIKDQDLVKVAYLCSFTCLGFIIGDYEVLNKVFCFIRSKGSGVLTSARATFWLHKKNRKLFGYGDLSKSGTCRAKRLKVHISFSKKRFVCKYEASSLMTTIRCLE